MPRREDRTPTFKGKVPVYLPTEGGAHPDITVGEASLKGGQLVIKFKDTLPGVAIQRMLERGSLLGVTFVVLQADAANLSAQERLAAEEAAAEEGDSDVEDIVKLNDDNFTVEDLVNEDPNFNRD